MQDDPAEMPRVLALGSIWIGLGILFWRLFIARHETVKTLIFDNLLSYKSYWVSKAAGSVMEDFL